MNKKFTPISELGEFGLIDSLLKPNKYTNSSTIMGTGDDAAVIKYLKNQKCLISTDMLAEGVHFDPTYTPLKHLGYKSITVNISDVCAMNGMATHALVSIGIPNKYSVEHIEELYSGIYLACKNYNIDLVGGDTTSSSSGLIISVTIIGEPVFSEVSYRSGANSKDIIFVSGDLGGAYLGLQILEREKQVFDKNSKAQPELEQYGYILERQLKPEARVDIIRELKRLQIQPSSMIDLSDGISSELRHICKLSNVGVKLFENKIPINKETERVALELNINPLVCALQGGEDYELLFTAPVKLYEKIKKIDSITAVGHVTSEPSKIELINSSNEAIDLTEEGWDSFVPR